MRRNIDTTCTWLTVSILAGLSCLLSGCRQDNRSAQTPATGEASPRVVAQGQILPAAGIVRLSAAPGDIVQLVEVTEAGTHVEAGTELVVMRSSILREKEISALQAQLTAARQEKTHAIDQAKRQIRIAEEKLNSLRSKRKSLDRQRSLLELGQQQLDASQQVLSKLESISQDQRTREFVGDIEVDRQQIAVGESQLKFEQQRESFLQASEDLDYAQQAAQLELDLAQEVLLAAQKSSAPSILQSQLDVAQAQLELSKITAPAAGTILNVAAKPGEASAQLPLVEMADLTELVCEVEINERDAARIEKGQKANISSRAFSGTIPGVVVETHKLVGSPKLRPLDPLARTDYRSVTAVVKLCDTEVAQNWLQLQVQVEILTSEKADCESTNESAESSPNP